MRQFLLAKSVAYASGTDLSKVADGAVGVFYNNNGVLTATSTGAEVTGEAMLVLGRKAENGGPIVLPIYKNDFSVVKSVYAAATTFEVKFTIPAAKTVGDYTLIVAAKGKKFNERNKWTAMVHITDTTTSADVLAKKLADAINANNGQNVTATAAAAVLTIKGNKAGVDFEVVPADLLMGLAATSKKAGEPALNDALYIADLAAKAAADAGFEYTYRDAVVDLYPNYPLNPLAGAASEDKGYTVFTIRFAEPRKVATTDEVVSQVVQVALPTGAAAIETLETVFGALAGNTTAAAAANLED